MKYSNYIILTGAGYTANYGGFLAEAMYERIFNNPKITSLSDEAQKIIKDADNIDYEGIYSDIEKSSEVDQASKNLVRELVVDAYRSMDQELKRNPNRAGGTWGKFGSTLMQKFIGRGEEKGFFFTLNQDLLYESRSGMMPYGIPEADAIKLTKKQSINIEDFIQLPNLEDVEKLKDRTIGKEGHKGDFHDLHDLNYIKLHGSYGWKSSDGLEAMIFGKNKPIDIEQEPLLNFYSWLFKEVLNRDGIRLLTIGYSFRDNHINDIILESINKHKLELIIAGGDMREIKKQLINSPYQPIWDARCGQFSGKLIEIFEDTHDKNLSTPAQELLNKFP